MQVKKTKKVAINPFLKQPPILSIPLFLIIPPLPFITGWGSNYASAFIFEIKKNIIFQSN